MSGAAKVSVSIDRRDLEFIDAQTTAGVFATRSAAVQAALRLLRERELERDYEEMFSNHEYVREASEWDVTISDGIS